MPRISEFIKELLAEPWDGTEYHAKLPERLDQLNAAQLDGIYRYLEKQVATSSFSIWSNANEKIMLQMKSLKDERIKIAEKEQKKRDDKDARERNKKALKKAKALEAIRVIERIKEVARLKAEKEVLDAEAIRESQEKLEIMKKVFDQEPMRNKVIASGCLFFIIGIVIVSSVVTNAIILGPVIVFIFIITIIIFYKAYLLSFVKPIIVPESEIERRIEENGAIKVMKAMDDLKIKEEKFKERQRLEAIEYQQIKENRKILKLLKEKEQQEIAQQQAIEHDLMMAAKADEIRRRKLSKKDINKEIQQSFIDTNNDTNNDTTATATATNNNDDDDIERLMKVNTIDVIHENDDESIGSIDSSGWVRERRGSDVSSITAFSLDINELGKSFLLFEQDDGDNKNNDNKNNDDKNNVTTSNTVAVDIKDLDDTNTNTNANANNANANANANAKKNDGVVDVIVHEEKPETSTKEDSKV